MVKKSNCTSQMRVEFTCKYILQDSVQQVRNGNRILPHFHNIISDWLSPYKIYTFTMLNGLIFMELIYFRDVSKTLDKPKRLQTFSLHLYNFKFSFTFSYTFN